MHRCRNGDRAPVCEGGSCIMRFIEAHVMGGLTDAGLDKHEGGCDWEDLLYRGLFGGHRVSWR